MNITLAHYLVLSAILFATSVIGIFLNRKNVIVDGNRTHASLGKYEFHSLFSLFG